MSSTALQAHNSTRATRGASLERAVEVLKEVIDAPIASYFSSCVHCGLCAEACLFYTETGEPKYTPIHKLEPLRRVWEREYTLLGRVKKWLGLSKPLTDEELGAWRELVYDSCTMCGRCSLVCPVGNDLVYMIRKLREGMALAGHAPPGVVAATRRTVEIGSPMGIRWPAVAAQIKHVEAETGLKVPIDQAGAEYMLLLSSMEIINFPEYLSAIARIMHVAGKTWTLCSEAFEATNSGIQIGVSDIARVIVARVVNAAERLQVKTVVSPECGHAYFALRWDGPNLMGRPFGFEVKHVLEVLDEFRVQGLIRTEGFEEGRLTFHDPCQIVRRGGVIEPQRHLMQMIARDFVEMDETGKYNWCCGGGGGVSANEEAEGLRLAAFKRKKAQLEACGAQTLVTACANCRIVLEEGLEHYQMALPVVGLTELVAKHLAQDDGRRQDEEG
ncbi:MAG: (Fe-S)-binding protein [Thiobacillaceae bacterium]|nr:(Fe-S)-binding protein [Thiobacillaceae bacterium]MCX7672139.1 (Fe-S)-binding protein [Thiobacillaceae bacterium]MDW8324396.1 (Fe-S)-binding protein [Burkholderiales bacterium]